jgi:NRPS condensation-like uncharacterized protein
VGAQTTIPASLPAGDFPAIVDSVGTIGDTHLHAAVDLPGRLDAGRLRDALERLALELPELRSRFAPGWWSSRWIPDPDADWTIEEHADLTPEQAVRLEDELFALPFERLPALPLQLRLLHLPDRDRLLARISHLLADGGGVKALLYRLAAACRGDDAPPPPRPPHPLWRLLRSIRPLRLPWLLWGLVREVTPPPRRVLAPPMAPGPAGPSGCEWLHLPADRVARLKARWKPEGITLNDVAMAALTRALDVSYPDLPADRLSLVVTTDFRQYERPRDDVCNYSNLRPLHLTRRPAGAPAEHVAEVARRSRAWKRGSTGLLAALSLVELALVLPNALLHGFAVRLLDVAFLRSGGCVALTNIGPIDAERLDFGTGRCLGARIAAPIGHRPLLLTALTGCDGALDFSVTFREGALPRSEVRRLVAAVDAELSRLQEPR